MMDLLTHPEQAEPLRAECISPDAAVDELLRYLSPQALAGPRFAITDLEIGTHRIRAGETVLPCLASANHDPDHFADPENVDLARTSNPQLGLGNALVRTVTGALLRRLLVRWPESRITVSEKEIGWRSGFRHRGPIALPAELP
ncbi:Biflaviolin synthase CYP158A1 [Nocardia sp. RB20]|uniref:Biflaviolin synthase CYP158A1 n=2 Tax=Nocardia macrotermitis TaxID=2585198 RepID=A0A7K0DAN0_9NOCA|nr:Biflaviolin synthase CYP158A1 [Nocardia macrotermitis]